MKKEKKEKFEVEETPEGELIRVRIPKGNEVIGIVQKLLGYCKMSVLCTDGNRRVCRVPGRLMRRMWIREGDIVIVQPWDVQSNERGDIIHRYTKTEAAWLKKKGYLEKLEEEF